MHVLGLIVQYACMHAWPLIWQEEMSKRKRALWTPSAMLSLLQNTALGASIAIKIVHISTSAQRMDLLKVRLKKGQ